MGFRDWGVPAGGIGTLFGVQEAAVVAANLDGDGGGLDPEREHVACWDLVHPEQ